MGNSDFSTIGSPLPALLSLPLYAAPGKAELLQPQFVNRKLLIGINRFQRQIIPPFGDEIIGAVLLRQRAYGGFVEAVVAALHHLGAGVEVAVQWGAAAEFVQPALPFGQILIPERGRGEVSDDRTFGVDTESADVRWGDAQHVFGRV